MFRELRNKIHYKRSRKAEIIYAVVCYADWCVREYKFADKWEWDDYRHEWVPLVYHYNDHNGEFETYRPVKMTNTTTGNIIAWTFNPVLAERMAAAQKALEKYEYGK